MAITNAQRVAAEAAFDAALARHPKAVRARYNRRLGRVVVSLDSGLELMFSPLLAQGLEGASVEDLSVIEVTPAGDGLHWPALDADLWVPGLLAGQFGSKAWMERGLAAGGRLGGWLVTRFLAWASRSSPKRIRICTTPASAPC
jgi:hypothetical protein